MQSLINNSNDYSAEFERRFYQKTAYQNAYEPVFYYVKPGDTLSQIITSYYDIRYGTKEYDYALLQVLFNNKHITNPNSIQPRQVISLLPMTPRYGVSMCLEEDAAQQDLEVLRNKAMNNNSVMAFRPNDSATQKFLSSIPSDPQERDMFWTLSWLQENYDILSVSTGSGLGMFGGIVRDQNADLIRNVGKAYNEYKNGGLTRGQYDYKRKKLLKNFSHGVGPIDRILFDGKNTQQAIRINRTKALPANGNITKYADRLNKLSKLAAKGGIVLTGIGVAKGAYDMCQADSRHEKNEIFVETIGGAIGGTLAGIGAGILLASTPIGWVGVLVIGAASALAGFGAGKKAKSVYNMFGDPVDFFSLTRAQAICDLGVYNPDMSFDRLKAL